MAKLDEITELLTGELEGLKQMLVQLKTLTKELTSSETVKDISQIRYKQEELNKAQDNHFREQNTGLSEVKQKVSTALLIPKWFLIMILAIPILSISTLGYLGYQVRQFEEEKGKAFQEGKITISKQFNTYFREHPEVYKGLLIWTEKEKEPNPK
ncbi:DUF6730 family protein [Arenibacter certesii]|uniref:Uncharacterized protein n=1 Tax=Arenibacter certesii TaxID=228955 RepID=A0A918J661_9FLAO|nr:DUF6730 family protein [Arenibacter certesii]GGW51493.1 hypothetical protein GCM10007383_38660 [Arenibacter certesii]